MAKLTQPRAKRGQGIRSHRDLVAWKESYSLLRAVYAITDEFPLHEQFGLVAQLRRAAVSVPSNIAEGRARGAPREFARFLRMALASLAELDTQIQLACDLRYVGAPDFHRLESALRRTHRLVRTLYFAVDRTARLTPIKRQQR